MCGIVGTIGTNEAAPLLLESLARLEYRGYDSAGIATLHNCQIERRRAEGKLMQLMLKVATDPLPGTIGIGHTRWATHGAPVEMNAHPHATDKVAVVHNGIIENYQELKAELEALGHRFESETDTEIIAHLVTHYLNEGASPEDAVKKSLKRFRGAFALAMIFHERPDLLIAARRGTPLALGVGDGAMYVASDAIALAPLTNRICYLSDGDWAVLTKDGAQIYDEDNQKVERQVRPNLISSAMIGKGEFRHFMLKEIHEQPEVIGDTLTAYVHPTTNEIEFPDFNIDFASMSRLTIAACGTAYYAGLVAKYWFEQVARLPVELDIASEFRYREAPMPEGGGFLCVSQSGETLDTLEALRYAARQNQTTMAVVNVQESTIAREAGQILFTKAGPEIGVASTKAFTTQLTALALLALQAAQQRGAMSKEEAAKAISGLRELPAKIAEVLRTEQQISTSAQDIAEARDVLYLGRGTSYPIALEGALKLKEISYIHAEGYAAGEMKHGPIALIDENVPIIAVAPYDKLFEKTASNLQEVAARGGKIFLLSDARGIKEIGNIATWTIEVPKCDAFTSPILYALPTQLLAYHVAVIKGTDVDQPRNLAKSVTVE